jgi:hypothetical protein
MPTLAQRKDGPTKSSRKIQLDLDVDVYLALKFAAAQSGRLLGRVASEALRASLPAVREVHHAE